MNKYQRQVYVDEFKRFYRKLGCDELKTNNVFAHWSRNKGWSDGRKKEILMAVKAGRGKC